MTAARWLAGLLVVVPVTAASAATGWSLRRLLVPHWRGPVATLAAVVLALGALLAQAHVLGLAGLLRPSPVVAVAVAAALAAVVAQRRSRPAVDPVAADAPYDRVLVAVVTVLVAAVTAMWVARTVLALRSGVTAYDSLDYHLPIAARFVQEGAIAPLHFIAADFGTFTFHPADAELLHAIGMLGWHRDPLVPLVNLGWFAATLLAGWCAGRPWRAAPLTLAATALLLGLPVLARGQPGTANNDIVATFAVVATVALLAHARDDVAAYLIAGLAAGLGLGAKLTVLVPFAIVTLALPLLLTRRRWPAVGAWSAGLTLAGSFWYLRNLATVGSPLPAVRLPLLPHADLPVLHEVDFTVAHYATDTAIWRDVFEPGVRLAFGRAWPLLLLGVAVAAVLALRGGDRLLRLLGVTALLAAAAYLVTPTTATGFRGNPDLLLFSVNLRYLTPALLLGLLAGACLLSRRAAAVQRGALGVALVVLAAAQTRRVWPTADRLALAAAALTAALVLAAVAVRRVHWLGSPVVAAVTGLVALLALWPVHERWAGGRLGGSPLASWADATPAAHIGMAGIRQHYPLLGRDLRHQVDYIGVRGRHGTFVSVPDCAAWRRQVNAGGYDYVVTGQGLAAALPEAWTAGPGATVVTRVGTTQIWRLTGRLDPATCP